MTPQSTTDIDSSDVEELVHKAFAQGASIATLKGFSQKELEILYSITYGFYQQRKFEEAENAFAFLCLYSHLDQRFWIGLGASREALKKYEAAVEAYSYAALLKHDNPIPPFQAAHCYLAMNNLPQAENALNAAILWSEGKPQHEKVLAKAQALLSIVQDKLKGDQP